MQNKNSYKVSAEAKAKKAAPKKTKEAVVKKAAPKKKVWINMLSHLVNSALIQCPYLTL